MKNVGKVITILGIIGAGAEMASCIADLILEKEEERQKRLPIDGTYRELSSTPVNPTKEKTDG